MRSKSGYFKIFKFLRCISEIVFDTATPNELDHDDPRNSTAKMAVWSATSPRKFAETSCFGLLTSRSPDQSGGRQAVTGHRGLRHVTNGGGRPHPG